VVQWTKCVVASLATLSGWEFWMLSKHSYCRRGFLYVVRVILGLFRFGATGNFLEGHFGVLSWTLGLVAFIQLN
jgi:hypothetical protein